MFSNSRYLISIAPVFLLVLNLACVDELMRIGERGIPVVVVDMESSALEIKKSEPRIRPVDPSEEEPGIENLICTDLGEMNSKSTGIPIYVDLKVARPGDGSSWEHAINGVALGLKRAFDVRHELLRSASSLANTPIYILVAGGTYSFSHEDRAIKASGAVGLGEHESLVRFIGIQGDNMKNIHLKGGYQPEDRCLEIAYNRITNPSGNLKRETILDGEMKSNHVILIAGDRGDKSVRDIHISDFTVTGGFAQGSNLSDPELDFHKKTGGALAIRGSAQDIHLTALNFKNSRAKFNGGCVAIAQSAENITFSDAKFSGCMADENGGALYIAENAAEISFDGIEVSSSHALGKGLLPIGAGLIHPLGTAIGGALQRFTGMGGAVYIASEKWNGEQEGLSGPRGIRIYENALLGDHYSTFTKNQAVNHGGAIAMAGHGLSRIELKKLFVQNNQALGSGGAIAIFNSGATEALPLWTENSELFPAPRFSLDNCKIHNNKALAGDIDQGGGGIALFGDVELVAIKDGSISANSALERGGGLMIRGTAHMISLHGVKIDKNTLARSGSGAGIFLASDARNLVQRIKILKTTIAEHRDVASGAGLLASGVSGLWLGEESVIAWNEAIDRGGGTYIWGSDHVTMETVTFNGNSAVAGGAAFLYNNHFSAHADIRYRNNSALESGGALHVMQSRGENLLTPGPMPMKNLFCDENSAGFFGGCAYMLLAPDTVIDGGNYKNNGLAKPTRNIPVVRRGGAIHYQSDSLNLAASDASAKLVVNNDARFSGNRALERGGALCIQDVFELEIENAHFIDNKAVKDLGDLGKGGAIYGAFENIAAARNLLFHQGAAVVIKNGTEFIDNEAVGPGGAFYSDAFLNTFYLRGVDGHEILFRNNKSDRHGGALHLGFHPGGPNSALGFSFKSVFEGNKALQVGARGGAVYIAQAPHIVEMRDAKFLANQSHTAGGAMSLVGDVDTVECDGVELSNNSTINGDGGAFCFGRVLHDVTIKNPEASLKNLHLAVIARVSGVPNPLLEDIAKITNNTAAGSGGAFFFDRIEGTLTIANQAWLSNSAGAGSGGALHVGAMGGNVGLKSSLMYGNSASISGGAVYLGDMEGNEFNLYHNDNLDAAGLQPIEYLKDPRTRLDGARVYPVGQTLAANTLDTLNGSDPLLEKRGFFLIEANKATNVGGAFFINNAGSISVDKMAFSDNRAATGGTMLVTNLQRVMEVRDSIIHKGRAENGNAGGLYLGGSATANDPRILLIARSSVQECEAEGVALVTKGSAGVYLHSMNSLEVRESNFFANKVLNAQIGSSWAAALSFNDRTVDPLPAINPAYRDGQVGVHMLLDPLALVPVQMAGPIILQDNTVSGAFNPPTTTATISIPAALKTLNYFGFTDNAFTVSGNVPAPPSAQPREVVSGH